MKKLLLATIFVTSGIWCRAFDWTYSTNLFWALPYVTNVFCGTNSTDTNRDNYLVIWNKFNHNETWLNLQQTANSNTLAASLASINASSNSIAIGITTNLQFTFSTNNASGYAVACRTNTLWFTNGLLQSVTIP